jgi:hypothetical protein
VKDIELFAQVLHPVLQTMGKFQSGTPIKFSLHIPSSASNMDGDEMRFFDLA